MKKILIGLLALGSINCIGASLDITPHEVKFEVVGKPLKIKKAFLNVRCLRKSTFFERFNNGMKDYETCDDFSLNGSQVSLDEERIELVRTGVSTFSLEQQLIKYSKYRSGHVCLRVYVELEREQGSTRDAFLVSNDNHSLLSFCSVEKLPFSINDYVYNNRREFSLKGFEEKLSYPIKVLLKGESF